MSLPPIEHLPVSLHGQPLVHINYLNVIFPHATCSIHAFVTLHSVRLNILRRTAASVDSSAHTFHKPIPTPLPRSKYDSPPSPSAISVPVAVYNLGLLCIQWCQNRDGTAAVGLCTVCALAPLDTAHSTTILHWTQSHWVTEDSAFVTVSLNVTDRTVPTAYVV